MKRSTITAQPVLELIGVQCLTVPPGQLQNQPLENCKLKVSNAVTLCSEMHYGFLKLKVKH